ncbi:MAG: UDP-N-acetylmuramoyl-L-alanyl-D-glutamate--2,6-diaminopimelate ligase [Pseudomonadota bacterium]
MQTLQTPQQAAQWLRQHVSGVLRTDSRQVQPGDGFIAWPGAAVDGRAFMASAFARGAAACLMQAEGSAAWQDLQPAERLAALPQLKQLTGLVADAYYEQPSRQLGVLAVTGTNGKTSTACWLAQALSGPVIGERCGVVGTLGLGLWPALTHTGMTTPDPVRLQQSFRDMVEAGASHCAIEASSIGLAEHRLEGTAIRVAIFTNFTQDHLDYHADMAAYWAAKRALFDWVGLRAAVVNIDDPKGAELAAELASGPLDLWTCSRQQAGARLRGVALPSREGLCFEVREADERCRVETVLTGDYNIDNLLGVIGALRAQGVPLAQAAAACSALQAVPGRMQRVAPAQPGAAPLAVVDYAHTPDALRQALAALAPLARERGGRLWCVFGCGGDRDPGKRPLMAQVAEQGADRVVLTSDNPRSESPAAILAQVRAGLRQPQAALVLEDRAQAIRQALQQAADADVLLVAGKGHETTQEIAGVFHPFSDVAQIEAALIARQQPEVRA